MHGRRGYLCGFRHFVDELTCYVWPIQQRAGGGSGNGWPTNNNNSNCSGQFEERGNIHKMGNSHMQLGRRRVQSTSSLLFGQLH